MKHLTIPAYFYPQCDERCLTGEPQRAPAGMPIEIVETTTSGRGKNKLTRILVRAAAPAGWGEWSARPWHAWVEQDAIGEQS